MARESPGSDAEVIAGGRAILGPELAISAISVTERGVGVLWHGHFDQGP